MDSKTDMLDALEMHLQSRTRQELDDEYESITHEKFWKRWVGKFAALAAEKRSSLISMAVEKYCSDEYLTKWYQKSTPESNSLAVITRYASVFGAVLPMNWCTDACKYIIDGKWIITERCGFSSFADIQPAYPETVKHYVDKEIEEIDRSIAELTAEKRRLEALKKSI